MNGDGRRCPDTGCEDNRDGVCLNGTANPFGFAASAFFMPGPMNFAGPLGPALGLMKNNASAWGAADEWGIWQDCPRRKQRESIQ